jgi:hypothetical protein
VNVTLCPLLELLVPLSSSATSSPPAVWPVLLVTVREPDAGSWPEVANVSGETDPPTDGPADGPAAVAAAGVAVAADGAGVEDDCGAAAV